MSPIISFRIKRLLIVTLLLVIFGGIVQYVYAGAGQSARGWAWGGGVQVNPVGYEGMGWISLNDIDTMSECDVDNNGFIDVSCGGQNTNATPWVEYGVDIPSSGDLSGYAWSKHYGWISFDGADLQDLPATAVNEACSGPTVLGQATRIGNNITGGARILSIRDAVTSGNAGDFDGCIKLDGLSVDPTDGSVDGYAWSSDLGWINFNGDGGNVVVALSSGNITGHTGCQLPDNVANPTCNGSFSWVITNASGPNIYNMQRGNPPCSTDVVGVNVSCTLNHGNNEIQARDTSATLDSVTVSADCSPVSTWDPVNSMCVPAPAAPTINITTNPTLVRSGQVAKIKVDIETNGYPLECDVYGVDGAQHISHPPQPPLPPPGIWNFSYGLFDTKPLTSAQIVQVKCTHALGIVTTKEIRVEVLPTMQEI